MYDWIVSLLIALGMYVVFGFALVIVRLSEIKKDLKTISSDIKAVKQNTKNKTKKAKPKNIKKQNQKKTYWGECPTCGDLVSSNLRYCLKCGQSLDWGGEK